MRRWRASTDVDRDERGAAALEFILVGLVLLVPIVYLVIALGMIQQHALGAEAGARHIARAVSTAPDADAARQRADAVLGTVAGEYGMDAARVDLSLACRPAVSPCPQAGATLIVTVRTQVSLPLVPPVLGLEELIAIPVEATAVQKASRVWGST